MEPKKNFEKLEVGSWYQRRDGVVIQITNFTENEKYPYQANSGSTYAENGNYYADREEPDFDLVQKVNDPTIDLIQEPKFKFGDRVTYEGEEHIFQRYSKDFGDGFCVIINEIYTITARIEDLTPMPE